MPTTEEPVHCHECGHDEFKVVLVKYREPSLNKWENSMQIRCTRCHSTLSVRGT